MSINKIHIVCSSGGVKCFSFIGAINRLYKSNIEIASISACSMGSVIGALIASGKHLQSDTWSTIGIVAGLVLMFFTKIFWIDSVIAVLFALIIIFTGYKIVRSSVAGIMDEADEVILKKLVPLLNANRKENWIDLHNLRIIKYGTTLHLDCHFTVPWYLNVHEAHREVDSLSALVKEEFGESVELFVHSDGCLDFSCAICLKQQCAVRKHPFDKKIEWTLGNISGNNKHKVTS